MSILILNSHATNVPTPSDDYIVDDFESGAISPGWDTVSGPLVVDSYGNFGIPAPPSGQSNMLQVQTAQTIQKVITATTDIWADASLLFQARTEWETTLINTFTDDVDIFDVAFTSAGKFAIRATAYSSDWQIGTSIYPDDTWVKCKVHVVIDAVSGMLQLWSWDGSAWVPEVDLQGINTWTDIRHSINQIRGPSMAKVNYYCDEVGFRKSDPGRR